MSGDSARVLSQTHQHHLGIQSLLLGVRVHVMYEHPSVSECQVSGRKNGFSGEMKSSIKMGLICRPYSRQWNAVVTSIRPTSFNESSMNCHDSSSMSIHSRGLERLLSPVNLGINAKNPDTHQSGYRGSCRAIDSPDVRALRTLRTHATLP